MTQYEIRFKTSAAKEFRKLNADVKVRTRKAINALKTEPRPPGVKKLVGAINLYRIRIGDYRVIYEINDEAQSVVVTRIRHRRDVYQ